MQQSQGHRLLEIATPPSGSRNDNMLAYATFHLQLDQAVHFDRVFHR